MNMAPPFSTGEGAGGTPSGSVSCFTVDQRYAMGLRCILSLSLAAGMIAAATEVRAAQASAVDPKQPALVGLRAD